MEQLTLPIIHKPIQQLTVHETMETIKESLHHIRSHNEYVRAQDLSGLRIHIKATLTRTAGRYNASHDTITVSAYMNPPQLNEAMLHELSHRAARPNRSHDHEWKKVALKYGVPPKATGPHGMLNSANGYTTRCLACRTTLYGTDKHIKGSDDGCTPTEYRCAICKEPIPPQRWTQIRWRQQWLSAIKFTI